MISIFALAVYLVCLLAVIGTGVFAAVSDYRGMTIPNYMALVIVAAFALCYGALYVADIEIFSRIGSHLTAGVVMFVITFLMFIARMIGGGDSKLAAAFAFWIGMEGMRTFLLFMCLMGLCVALAAIILKRVKPIRSPRKGSWIARVQAGESVVPYGIAIVFGAFVAFLQLGFLSPDNLSLFLIPN